MKKSHQPIRGSLLIVEDEKIIAKDITNTLKKFGYIVPAIVASGEDAIRKLEDTQVDLILMDIVLKGDIDGVEAAKEIYERFKIPVVHLTAYADDETLDRVKEANPFGYVIKPFKERELYMAIEMALHRHRTVLDEELEQEKRTEELRLKLQRLQQFSDVKDSLFKKFLRDLSDPLLNLNVAIRLLKENPIGPKSDHYLRIISEEFEREVELINQTSNLEDLLNVENVELLNQFSLLRKHTEEIEAEKPVPPTPLAPVVTPSPVVAPPPEPVVVQPTRSSAPTPSPAPKVVEKSTPSPSPSPSRGSSQTRPLNQTQLAERLGVVVSAITYWKFKAGFPEWSRSKDPEGISWKYSPESKRFSPV